MRSVTNRACGQRRSRPATAGDPGPPFGPPTARKCTEILRFVTDRRLWTPGPARPRSPASGVAPSLLSGSVGLLGRRDRDDHHRAGRVPHHLVGGGAEPETPEAASPRDPTTSSSAFSAASSSRLGRGAVEHVAGDRALDGSPSAATSASALLAHGLLEVGHRRDIAPGRRSPAGAPTTAPRRGTTCSCDPEPHGHPRAPARRLGEDAADPSWPTTTPPLMSAFVVTSIIAGPAHQIRTRSLGVQPEPVALAGPERLVELVEVAHDVGAELRRAVRVDGEVLLLLLLAALGAPAVAPSSGTAGAGESSSALRRRGR